MSEFSSQALAILSARYYQDGESSPEQVFRRVARSVASAELENCREHWEEAFYKVMITQTFLPNSPTIKNAGTKSGCLSACFARSPIDSMEDILQVQKEWGLIEKWGGGVGMYLGHIRPKGSKISSTHGEALGPVSVMEIYSSNAAKITQGSFRNGAHMAQLPIWHPDIQAFIHCKDKGSGLSNFNISVQITDSFMKAVEQDEWWNLINPHNGEVAQRVRAKDLWKEIVYSAHKRGDPGVVFIDKIQESSPNPSLGIVEAFNPCGEQALEDGGSCNLGSINLSRFVNPEFDWDSFSTAIRVAVRFLDDVIDINEFPLENLASINKLTRRIGLGVMGFADALVLLKIPYDSDKALAFADNLSSFLTNTALDESAKLATEKGSFPLFAESLWAKKGFQPLRNSCVTSIAPTGTISLIADCSSGIEPYFALAWPANRLWNDDTGEHVQFFESPRPLRQALKELVSKDEEAIKKSLESLYDGSHSLADYHIDPALYRTALSISPESHVKILAAWQKNITNSVSKTINLSNSTPPGMIDTVFKLAWKLGCKGITVYRDGSREQQVLETPPSERKHTGIRSRKSSIGGVTERVKTGHGNLYVTVNADEAGPFEAFTQIGKSGGCDGAYLEGLARMISLAFRNGASTLDVVNQLRGIACCVGWDEGIMVRSPVDGIALAIERATTVKASNPKPLASFMQCPECSGALTPQEGCSVCLICGWNKCGG